MKKRQINRSIFNKFGAGNNLEDIDEIDSYPSSDARNSAPHQNGDEQASQQANKPADKDVKVTSKTNKMLCVDLSFETAQANKAESTSDKNGEDSDDNKVESANESAPKPTTEPVIELAPKPTIEPVIEPAPKLTIEPVIELAPKPTIEPANYIPSIPDGLHGPTVGDLLEYLFRCYPESYCEPWDACGLLVGDSSVPVRGVAIALDPDVKMIKRAADMGCNVLLTHHPAYLEAPKRLVDKAAGGDDSAARAIEAIKHGVALIAMHTNLDRSPLAAQALLLEFDLVYAGEIMPAVNEVPGFGCLAMPEIEKGKIKLVELAQRCVDSSGRRPRVWGDPEHELKMIAIANGSSSSLMSAIVSSGAECLITGEMSYHKACELHNAGVDLIELGHDISELPLVECLRKTIESNSEFAFNVRVLDPEMAWWQPRMEEE